MVLFFSQNITVLQSRLPETQPPSGTIYIRAHTDLIQLPEHLDQIQLQNKTDRIPIFFHFRPKNEPLWGKNQLQFYSALYY